MKKIISFTIILLLFFCSGALAHRDRIIHLSESGDLEGLPEQYLPARLNLDTMTFQIGNTTLNFPVCISKYFPLDKDYRIKITSSWYHKKSSLPSYINLKISPNEKDFAFSLLFELDTLKPIKFRVFTYNNDNSYHMHELKIDDDCQEDINSSYNPK